VFMMESIARSFCKFALIAKRGRILNPDMTDQQKRDFALYGCASACLIRLSQERKKPIQIDDFVQRYAALFQDGRCGLLPVDRVCEIVMGWQIYEAVNAVRDPAIVKQIFIPGADADALVLTDLTWDRASQKMVPNFHCCLALDWRSSETIMNDEILLFWPSQDSEPEEVWVPLRELEKRLVHFLVLS
jgi:hypothetical protein